MNPAPTSPNRAKRRPFGSRRPRRRAAARSIPARTPSRPVTSAGARCASRAQFPSGAPWSVRNACPRCWRTPSRTRSSRAPAAGTCHRARGLPAGRGVVDPSLGPVRGRVRRLGRMDAALVPARAGGGACRRSHHAAAQTNSLGPAGAEPDPGRTRRRVPGGRHAARTAPTAAVGAGSARMGVGTGRIVCRPFWRAAAAEAVGQAVELGARRTATRSALAGRRSRPRLRGPKPRASRRRARDGP